MEWADLTQAGLPEITFDTHSLDRNNSNITIGYTIYGIDQEIISRGMQQVELKAVPEEYALHYNYPNPFNPVTTMLYDLPEAGYTRLIIYDLMGRQVQTLVDQPLDAGFYQCSGMDVIPKGRWSVVVFIFSKSRLTISSVRARCCC